MNLVLNPINEETKEQYLLFYRLFLNEYSGFKKRMKDIDFDSHQDSRFLISVDETNVGFMDIIDLGQTGINVLTTTFILKPHRGKGIRTTAVQYALENLELAAVSMEWQRIISSRHVNLKLGFDRVVRRGDDKSISLKNMGIIFNTKQVIGKELEARGYPYTWTGIRNNLADVGIHNEGISSDAAYQKANQLMELGIKKSKKPIDVLFPEEKEFQL